MSNKEIADQISELASLMEIHGENEFKIRNYSSAYITIKKMDISLLEKSKEELTQLKVINKAVVEKISELASTGQISALEELRAITPEGVRQMLKIKGVGPKKVIVFWKEMKLESIGELLYACKENRLLLYKGFGPKIQEDIIKNIEYLQSNADSFLYARLLIAAEDFKQAIIKLNPKLKIEITGDLRRAMPTLDRMELIANNMIFQLPEDAEFDDKTEEHIIGKWKESFPFKIYLSSRLDFISDLVRTTAGSETFCNEYKTKDSIKLVTEEEFFINQNKEFIPAECRDLDNFSNFSLEDLIQNKDIKGVIHNHSKYSDGMYDMMTMAEECIRLGYQYLVMSDHSKTAAYANGLAIERVEMQWREIDQLNKTLAPFKIYKSIESDILADGSLDYPEDILQGFDLVIASIHSNLNMDQEKAMMRLIKAIENPNTDILGHLTGRLLLSRKGYPIDHRKIIEACAINKVSIELNANPVRLDLDWKWIPYAMEKGVMISINPDAHNLKGIQDILYGVLAARKGGLKRSLCLNTLTIEKFEEWIQSNK